jgi:hypothetical protein
MIAEEIDAIVAPPPRVHVDPHGRQFRFDDVAG